MHDDCKLAGDRHAPFFAPIRFASSTPQYLAVLDDAAFGSAIEVTPKTALCNNRATSRNNGLRLDPELNEVITGGNQGWSFNVPHQR